MRKPSQTVHHHHLIPAQERRHKRMPMDDLLLHDFQQEGEEVGRTVYTSTTKAHVSGKNNEDISPTLLSSKTLSKIVLLVKIKDKEKKGKAPNAEKEELLKQQKKRKAQVQFEAQYYTNEDWDLIRAKLEANAELSKSMLGSELQGEDFAKKMVDIVNQRKKLFAEKGAKHKRTSHDPITS
ncbi:hypothetical protein Tco_0615308 [Tanacetum coccineum]